MAFAIHPEQTALVQVGEIRHVSDLAGKRFVRMDNSVAKRQELAIKLEAAGCSVDWRGTDWHTVGDLTPARAFISREKTGNSQSPFKFHDNVYWRIKEGGTKEGPFCPHCWDIDGKEVRLKRSEGEWECVLHGYGFRSD